MNIDNHKYIDKWKYGYHWRLYFDKKNLIMIRSLLTQSVLIPQFDFCPSEIVISTEKFSLYGDRLLKERIRRYEE